MGTSFNPDIPEILNKVTYLTGSAELAANLLNTPAKKPFDERMVDFLNEVSREDRKSVV